MRAMTWVTGVMMACVLLGRSDLAAQDWPQWMGPNRDAKTTGFEVPETWPQELTAKWDVTVGEGVATPALVDDRLYVFARQEGNEILRCLDANTGEEFWENRYEAEGASGPANRFSGPRSSPTVAEGKIVTLGVRGTLSCVNAVDGATAWRKNDFPGAWPRFFTSSSPIVLGELCIAQLGGQDNGAIVAYDLTTGDQKWSWSGDGAAYASPVLLAVEGTEAIIAETDKSVISISIPDGKLLWQVEYVAPRRGYNAATPIVDGSTLIYSGSGRGTTAVKLQQQGDQLAAKELWSNDEDSVQFNSPILKNGLIFGITARDSLFCLDAQSGETAWTAPVAGGRGYGSIVDAGPVLVALTPAAQLVVFEPTGTEYKEVASYKVSEGGTYAYPVLAGNRVYVKDQESVRLWAVE